MEFRQMLLAWKSTLVRDSQPILGVVPKDLHPARCQEDLVFFAELIKVTDDLY
jgi:hypothetical protein